MREVDTRIIGIGSWLNGDDAVGLVVAERLSKEGLLPEGVEVIEAPGDPVALLQLIESCRRALILDAAEMELPPGSVRMLGWRELPERFIPHHSLHAIGLLDILAMARRLGVTTDVSLVAIQPESCDYSAELSPPVAQQLSSVIDLVLKEVTHET